MATRVSTVKNHRKVRSDSESQKCLKALYQIRVRDQRNQRKVRSESDYDQCQWTLDQHSSRETQKSMHKCVIKS
eukprot:3904412-Amphidinium_carterae.1